MKKIAFACLGIMLAGSLVLSASARDITGKVIAVYHEPVVVNTKTLDKVSVTVNSCASGQWETYSYSPGLVSDDNSLGFLYRDLTNAGRLAVMKNQFMNMVSGHVTLAVNDQNTIVKTTFWGYNWECGRNIDGPPASGGAPVQGGGRAQATPPPQNSGSAPPNAFGALKRLGF